jgi:hypothetical protein
VIELLKNGDYTIPEIREISGISRNTIRDALNELKQAGQVHVCGLKPPSHSGPHIPIYRYGPGDDVKLSERTTGKYVTPEQLAERKEKIKRKRAERREKKKAVDQAFINLYMSQLTATAWKPKKDFQIPEPDDFSEIFETSTVEEAHVS